MHIGVIYVLIDLTASDSSNFQNILDEKKIECDFENFENLGILQNTKENA